MRHVARMKQHGLLPGFVLQSLLGQGRVTFEKTVMGIASYSEIAAWEERAFHSFKAA